MTCIQVVIVIAKFRITPSKQEDLFSQMEKKIPRDARYNLSQYLWKNMVTVTNHNVGWHPNLLFLVKSWNIIFILLLCIFAPCRNAFTKAFGTNLSTTPSWGGYKELSLRLDRQMSAQMLRIAFDWFSCLNVDRLLSANRINAMWVWHACNQPTTSRQVAMSLPW